MKLKQLLIFCLLFVSFSSFAFEMKEVETGNDNSNGHAVINKIQSGILTTQEIEELKKKMSLMSVRDIKATPKEAYGRQGQLSKLTARHYLHMYNETDNSKVYTFYIKLECEGVKVDKRYDFSLRRGDWAVYDINLYLNFMPPYRNSEYRIDAYSQLSGGESLNSYNHATLHT